MNISDKVKSLKPTNLNCNVFDVYSYDGLSMQDLLCQFFTTINECVSASNEVMDLTEWLINVGLEEEVVEKLMELIQNGTVEKLINVDLFKSLNNEINVLSSQLAQKASQDWVNSRVWNMANIGQDVKEAMTGGSVAVVGKNSILNDNIVDGQISINKLDPLIYTNELNMYKIDMSKYSGQNFIGFKSKTDCPVARGSVINVKNLCVYTKTKRTIEVAIYDGSFVSEIQRISDSTSYENLSFTVNKDINLNTARFIIGTSSTEMVHIPTHFSIAVNNQSVEYVSCDVFGNQSTVPVVSHFDNSLATYKYVDEIAKIDDGEIRISNLNEEFYKTHKNWSIYGNMGNVNACASSPTFVIPSSYFGNINVGDIVTVECIIQIDESMLDKVKSYETYLITSSKNTKDSGIIMNNLLSNATTKSVAIKHNHKVTKNMLEYIHILIASNLNGHGFIHNISDLKVTINSMTYNVEEFGHFYGTDTSYVINTSEYLPKQFVAHGQLSDINSNKDKWLYGKRWGILGDSLSDPIYTREYNYFTYISRKYNMELDNQAKSGASLLNSHGCFKQLQDLSGEFDLITCWIGTNDYNYQNTKTYGDKIEELINGIIGRFPNTRIMFISPGNNVHVNGLEEDINRTNSMYQYVLELQKRCLKYSIPVLDLYTHAGFNPHVDVWNQKYYKNEDKCHYNAEGMARINPIIEDFLLSH